MLGYDSPLRRVLGPAFAPAMLLTTAVMLVSIPFGAVIPATVAVAIAAIFELGTTRPEPEQRQRFRTAGFPVRVRVLIRALLLAAVVAVSSDDSAGVLVFVVASLAVQVATWRVRSSIGAVIAAEPVNVVRNISDGHVLATLYTKAEARRAEVSGLLHAFEGPLAVMLAARVVTDLPGWGLTAGSGAVAIAAIVVGEAAALWRRRFESSGRRETHLAALRAQIEAYRPEIVAYYSGPLQTSYWINQWLPALNRLDRRILILTREATNARQVGETRFPIILGRATTDVEMAVTSDTRVVLYFGNAGKNVHMLRYPELKHVFLNHGDSDKATSASPVARVYDRIFVAGPLGVERYVSAGLGLVEDRFAIVGRPQLDGLHRGPLPSDGNRPPTLLYAPTFEGFFEDINYSSLEVMGERLVATVLQELPHVRIVFKPHPYTGMVNPVFAAAQRRIEKRLRIAGAPHVIASGQPDRSLHDWFEEADVLMTDVSSVASDFMVTERPYLITNPRGIASDTFRREFLSCGGAGLIGPDCGDLVAEIEDALGDDRRADMRAAVAARVLGTHPDGPQASFARALDQVVREAEESHQHVTSTFSFR